MSKLITTYFKSASSVLDKLLSNGRKLIWDFVLTVSIDVRIAGISSEGSQNVATQCRSKGESLVATFQ